MLRTHFGRDIYDSVRRERTVSVLERSQPVPGARAPLPIDWDESEFTAVVVLAESNLVEDREWVEYVRDIAEVAHRQELPARFFPVILNRKGLELNFDQQPLR